ncbi:DUF1361 domain-containing protein [Kordia sp. SMS9]|uniref:DUF1361 domain-containing protein n=1 Tax=Kordia sp. SMS9 TaxID=2282170 RepID=UPI0013B38821|nr:DUF1361 domain-containing protein [Kordia sp. SMS9]
MHLNISKTHRFLAIFSTFCIALLLARILIKGSMFYVFLVWNLFLAIIPYAISSWLLHTRWIRKHTFPLCIFLGIWLLFLPNAPYLITDLMHLRYAKSSVIWFDALLLFAFALNGLLLGIFSLQHVFQVLMERWNVKTAKRILFCVVFLCGFGMYLGRFLRWNSWELFSDPMLLAQDCFRSILYPAYRMKTWGITLGFGSFLWVLLLGVQTFIPIKKATTI